MAMKMIMSLPDRWLCGGGDTPFFWTKKRGNKMSHVVGIDFAVDSLDHLAKAAEACGCELVRNQKTWKWYGQWMDDYDKEDAAYKRLGVSPQDYGRCEHAIRVRGDKSAYEVGVIKNPNGDGFRLVWDFYGSQGAALQSKIGKAGSELTSQYTFVRISQEAKQRGKLATMTRKDSKIVITVK